MAQAQIPPRCIGRCPLEGREIHSFSDAFTRNCEGPQFEEIQEIDGKAVFVPLNHNLPVGLEPRYSGQAEKQGMCRNAGFRIAIDTLIDQLGIK